MEIWDRYRDYIPVYIDGSRDGNYVACATVFPSNTVISMKLPDSASIFTAEIWAIIKALEQIKNSAASKYIVFTDSHSCLQALQCMKLEHPLIGMVILFVGYPAIPVLDVTKKADSAARSALELPHAGLMYPILILNIVSTSMCFPLDKMVGMVRLRTNCILSSRCRWCRKDDVVLCRAHIGHIHLTRSYILKKDSPPHCEHCQFILTVRHILKECNHFAEKRKDIFRKRNVVESFKFLPHSFHSI